VESVSVLLTDLDESPEPQAVFTGDTLFVGDVGRPDLAPDLTPQELAGLLYDSLHEKLLTLPDDVRVYPAHGAGSLCGRQMSSERSSTIARERQTNHALQARTRQEFVEQLTRDLPPRPAYFHHDVEMNRTGAPALEHNVALPGLTPGQLLYYQKDGCVVLDTRPAIEFAAAHVPGSFHIALGGQFASWAARMIGPEERLVLVAEDAAKVEETRMRLARVGAEHVLGYLEGGVPAWLKAGYETSSVPQVSAAELSEWSLNPPSPMAILDVREPGECAAGAIAGSLRVPLGQLPGRLAELPSGPYLFVHCKGGYRSSIATSLLRRAGFDKVVNVTGGFDAWAAAGLPVAVEGGSGGACSRSAN